MGQGGKKKGNMLVWGLMGMLILALGGFGATNFSGTTRSLGTVGEAQIAVNDYMRSLQSEMRAFEAQIGTPISFQQAQALGLPQRVMARLIQQAALEDEAARIGLSVGDERLAGDLRAIAAFQGLDGQFSRETYEMVLENANLSEAEFEAGLRAQNAAALVQGAVLAGITLPASYGETLVSHASEARGFTWAEIGPERMTTGIASPTEAQLQAYYDENIADFTRPEARMISYVWLTPEMLVDTVEIDEASLREAYEDRTSEFNLPERRLVERLVFADEAAADAAAARLTSGEIDFEGLVAERGLALLDTDLGDVSRADLGDAAELVFAAGIGAVAGPAPSDLGAPALYRVNAVLAAQETSYEEAVPMLRGALALDRARRVIENQWQGFDDDLAGGATLEDLAEMSDLELDQIAWTGFESDAIAGFEAFREAAMNITPDDYPAITGLGDGGVFALRLDEIRPAAPIPLDEIRSEVSNAWDAQAMRDALLTEAQTLAGRLSEGATFADLSLNATKQEPPLSRRDISAGIAPADLIVVFDMTEEEIRAISRGETALILRLDEVVAADLANEENIALADGARAQAANDVANDLYQALSRDIQNRAGVQIDQAVLNAVHANFQ